MWYGEHGVGESLVLLHPGGAGVDSRALDPIAGRLSKTFHIFTPEQRGHGRTPDVEGSMTFSLMAQDTIRFIETVVRHPVYLLGYSDGAIIALTVTLSRPDLVRKLVFAAGVFHRDGWLPGVLGGEPPEFLRQSYAELSPDGPDHYDSMVAKLALMHDQEPALTPDDLYNISCRTLIVVADDDEVRFEHAVQMYRSVQNAELAIVPGTSHGLLVEKPDLFSLVVTDFLTQDPVKTVAPIRRHPGGLGGAGT